MSYFLMVSQSFSGVIIVLSSDVVNSIFCISLMIFVKVLPRDLCDGLDFITICINEIEYTQWWFARSQYQPLTKAIFSSPEIWGNILNIFWRGLKPPKLLYIINLDTWSCIVLLDIVLYGHLCLLLGISNFCFAEDMAHEMWCIFNGGDRICRYQCTFETYE